MGDAPFHLTHMGKRFYEATMPALVAQLERLNQNLERLTPVFAQNAATAALPAAAPPGANRDR
jgi:hypothetical protein